LPALDPVIAPFVGAVEQARYEADLAFIAHERVPGSAHWQAVQNLCRDRFTELGYQVELHAYGSGVNVVGVKPGGALVMENVLISAHYDHIPGCAGADDNATGVAGVLESARVLSTGSFRRTLVVVCWDEEERGLIGSEAYADRAQSAGQVVAANFVYEMIGFRTTDPHTQRLPDGFGLLYPDKVAELEAKNYAGDFIAYIHDTRSNVAAAHQFEIAGQIALESTTIEITDDLISSGVLNDVFRSDHAPFWRNGYPGIMITDTSEFRYLNYHCHLGPDVVQNLDAAFSTQVIQVTVGSAVRMLEPM
jgi:Zn-dependent M28 family amino/carboxypeptidase